jgi:hypothetical protein
MGLVYVRDLANRLHFERLYIVWEGLLLCIQCGMILIVQLFVCALSLMIFSTLTFCVELHYFSSRSF